MKKLNPGYCLLLCAFPAMLAVHVQALEAPPASVVSPPRVAAEPRRAATVRVVTPPSDVLRAVQADKSLAASSGQKVHVDPATKQIREPGPEESRQLSELSAPLFARSPESLMPVFHANGMITVDLQGTFLNAALARVGPDGRVLRSCVTNAQQAETFLSPAPVVPTREERKEASHEK